jgi:MFS transporter, ACS family, allantoate permease
MGAVSIGGPYKSSPWKYIYILLGSISTAYGIFLLFFFPDSPMKARFLTERERNIAVQRLRKNNTGMQTRQFKSKQVIESFKDPQMYLITVILFTFAFANQSIGRYVVKERK